MFSKLITHSLFYFLESAKTTRQKGTTKATVKKTSPKNMDNAAPAGVSIRNGPVIEESGRSKLTGTSNSPMKRKSRSSMTKSINYNEDVDEDEDSEEVPLVCVLK